MNRNRIKLCRKRKFRGIIFWAMVLLTNLSIFFPSFGIAATELISGVPVNGTFGRFCPLWFPLGGYDYWQFYEITSTAVDTEILVELSGFFQLYVRRDIEPSATDYDCLGSTPPPIGGFVFFTEKSCTLPNTGVTTWYIGVRGSCGIGSEYTIMATLNNGDSDPPSVPTNLEGSALSSTQIDLSWDSSSDGSGLGVRGYKVYRDSNLIGETNSTNYSDTDLTQGTQYTYQVSAFDSVRNESSPCPAISVTVPIQIQIDTSYQYDAIGRLRSITKSVQ